MTEPAPRNAVALGLSVHTGWAACVAAAGSLRAPQIVLREELELLGDPQRFVFHRAAEMPRPDAKRSVARAESDATARAQATLAQIVAKLRESGRDVVGCAIVANAGAMLPLDEIVVAHPRIHSAEGLFYRDALRAAADALSIPVRFVPPRQLDALAAKSHRLPADEIAPLLAAAGRTFGRPWSKDQKLAALAAWTVLAS